MGTKDAARVVSEGNSRGQAALAAEWLTWDCKLGKGRRVPSSPVQEVMSKGNAKPTEQGLHGLLQHVHGQARDAHRAGFWAVQHGTASPAAPGVQCPAEPFLLNQFLPGGQRAPSAGAAGTELGGEAEDHAGSQRSQKSTDSFTVRGTEHRRSAQTSSSSFKRCWTVKAAQRIPLPEI